MSRVIDLKSMRFGRLTVLAFAGTDKYHRALWRCLCECGAEKVIAANDFKSGRTVSCGCFQVEKSRECLTTHGMRSSVEYRAFYSTRQRCEDIKYEKYHNYGGRGIKFLFTSFEQFFAELGPRPSAKHSVDRKDNNGNYEHGNVKWSTASEQRNNQRKHGKC